MTESLPVLPESFVHALTDRTNIIFFLVIWGLFALGILLCRRETPGNFREFLPSLCTSIGVFGTFVGIFTGLLEFDTGRISESIPALLDGMKTAFFTSLMGMLASLLLRSIYTIQEDRKERTDETTLLLEMRDSAALIATRIEMMNQSLVGLFSDRDTENSLVNQVTLIREEIRDNHEKTQKILQEMLTGFAENVSQNLVEQLKTVIDRFNVMLNDLVAESFSRLRESTENLNTWQNKYREQILTNEENLERLVYLLETTGRTYDDIARKLTDIGDSLDRLDLTGEQLSLVTQTLHQETTQFTAALEQLEQVGAQARRVIPEIEQKLEAMLDEIREMEAGSRDLLNETTGFQKRVSDLLMAAGRELTDTVSKTTRSVDEAIARHMESTQEGLQKALTQSLTTFAGSLAELSRRFAMDYLPLTERLREILEIAEKIRPET